MSKLETFVEVFDLPPAMIPYAAVLVSEQEMQLVVGLADRALTLDQIAEVMDISNRDDQARHI